jgi:hypothetical protein
MPLDDVGSLNVQLSADIASCCRPAISPPVRRAEGGPIRHEERRDQAEVN